MVEKTRRRREKPLVVLEGLGRWHKVGKMDKELKGVEKVAALKFRRL